MSFANFGIGLGAFAQGLNQGISAGKQLRSIADQNKINRVQKEGMAEAKQARSAAIDGLIETGSGSNADNTMTVPTYKVGGQSFADQTSARKAAEGQVGGLAEFYQKVAAPKIYEKMLEIDPQKAAAWKEFNENEQVKEGQRHWAAAIAKANAGDFEGFGQSLMKAYNTRGYFDDGTKVTKWDSLKDDKGNITGVNLTFKGADGKEYTQTVNGMQDAYKIGSYMLSPENVFKYAWAERQAAQKTAAELAKEDRTFKQNVYRDDRKAAHASELQTQRDNSAMDRTVTGKQMDAATKTDQFNRKVEALKTAGYSPEWINQNMPAIMGIGEFKKPADPTEVRRMFHQARIQSDYSYGRKTQAEQSAILDNDMKLIYGDQPQKKNAMSGGLGAPAVKPGQGPMILDMKSGTVSPYGR